MLTLGMDIGSTTSKCVILRNGQEVVAQDLIVGGIGTKSADEVYRSVLKKSGLSEQELDCLVATGYGRKRWETAELEVSELTAHALGCHMLLPEARTIIDIGGQDAKVITLDAAGQMSNFIMNDKCAAGTGRFLDVMAGILKLDVDQFGSLAGQSQREVNISSTCTVFAESEVISQLANGAEIPDVVAGICRSVAVRVAALARRAGVKDPVCMSGGVSRNEAVRGALEQALGTKVVTFPMAQTAGALGAALYGYRKTIQRG